MPRIVAVIAIVVILLITVWAWIGREPERPSGGSQQPAPHAIDQNG
ncbi:MULTISPECIES: hypothetical protein [unclassified Mesorhizobium]|nr:MULTISPECIES: hypothetical protein [unclassified Mesorhizobium]MDF3178590.1 hypothetical protein [Mesorhizobium sp. P17.1]MDG4886718.1 hypothetical protein [Mesorhizobium sp. WSM4887]MDG4906890.1 hypothetical protein [Mesorhizobium sp. WSM4898]